MKTLPPETDEDYEGGKGCLVMVIVSIATLGAIAAAIIIGYLVNELIKLIS